MSGICGFAGPVDPTVLDLMLAAIDYRGDRSDRALAPGVGLGHRFWAGRPGKSSGAHREGPDLCVCAGGLAPPVSSPAAALGQMLARGAQGLTDVDGAFAAARWEAAAERLTLARDPFGIRSLYYAVHGGALYFASELKQLLAVPDLPVELDAAVVHKYLTFSFVPGEELPIRGVRRLLPGHILTWTGAVAQSAAYFALEEEVDPALGEQAEAVRRTRRVWRQSIERRLHGEEEVGLYLSGGLDSAAVAVALARSKTAVRAYSLDFGDKSVEKPQAIEVARSLDIPLTLVAVGGQDISPILLDLVWKLDLPFGDPVTGPQFLLGRSARQDGLTAVFNGEGGDQLFGGWTTKPMIAAELYSGLYGDESREEAYLHSYHRFYGHEDELYTPAFRAEVGGPGQRRAVLHPHLHSDHASSFLTRVRLADLGLKGSFNIAARAERMGSAWGLDVRMPLFDRKLAELSFRMPPAMKLRGATEKYVLKLAMQKFLPREIVWRPKSGMRVPITDWVLGPLADQVEELVGPRSLAARGLFRGELVSRLRSGQVDPGEGRRRRIGERLWTLLMLEAWLRIFVDQRGRRPGTAP